MDVQMPEMDGFTATLAIRERERGTGRHIPVVAMTAHAMRGDEARCIEAGMDTYLAKPIQLERLIEALNRVAPELRPADPTPRIPVST
jgi:CheY-like chemotaxis protein